MWRACQWGDRWGEGASLGPRFILSHPTADTCRSHVVRLVLLWESGPWRFYRLLSGPQPFWKLLLTSPPPCKEANSFGKTGPALSLQTPSCVGVGVFT